MLTRKPSILFATYVNFYSVANNASGSSTSLSQRRKSTRHQQCCQQRRRRYATITGDHEEGAYSTQHEQHPWPTPPHGRSTPTPYQIFAMKTTATYSKARFHELVKIYHPDRPSNPDSEIPRTIRTERYRLIIAAHTILSDPAKRSAYDRFGAGWDGRAEAGGGRPGHPPGPFSQNWSDPKDPIWQNATWEDWQRYYAWKNGHAEGVHRRHQAPVYLQNSYFLLLVAIFALMGGTANYTRAQDYGASFVERRDVAHDRAAKELRRVRQEASSGSRQDRIDWFVRNREATRGVDVESVQNERADRLLPGREVCRSEEIVEKNG